MIAYMLKSYCCPFFLWRCARQEMCVGTGRNWDSRRAGLYVEEASYFMMRSLVAEAGISSMIASTSAANFWSSIYVYIITWYIRMRWISSTSSLVSQVIWCRQCAMWSSRGMRIVSHGYWRGMFCGWSHREEFRQGYVDDCIDIVICESHHES